MRQRKKRMGIALGLLVLLSMGAWLFFRRSPQEDLFQEICAKPNQLPPRRYQGKADLQRPDNFIEILPTWKPDDYRFEKTGANSYDGILFKYSGKPTIYYFQRYADESFLLDNGLASLETLPFDRGGYAMWVEAEGVNTLIATRGDYTFYFKGKVDAHWLHRMLESVIKQVEP